MGGTCGDLVTVLLDDKNSQIDCKNGKIILPDERTKLKKHNLFRSDADKDQYLHYIFQRYTSIPSHNLDWHIEKSHKFIGIKTKNPKTALWAAARFKNLHRPNVWAEVQKATGANTVNDYAEMLLDYGNLISDYTDKIIDLDEILNGLVLEKLPSMGYSLSKGYKELFKQYISCLNTSVNTELIY